MVDKEKRDVSEVFNFCYLPDNERFERWYERTTFEIQLMKQQKEMEEKEEC